MQVDKVLVFDRLLIKFGLSDIHRWKSNNDNDKAGFTFNPKRITSNPLRIDYILISSRLIDEASALSFDIGPKSDINSDHEYLSFNIYFSKKRKSRNERREYFRFPDYLLANNKFTELLDNNIRSKLNKRLEFDQKINKNYLEDLE